MFAAIYFFILYFLFSMKFVVSEKCGSGKYIDLRHVILNASSKFNWSDWRHAVDGDLSTSVSTTTCLQNCTMNDNINWFILDLGQSSQYRFVESVEVIPARPRAKSGETHYNDKKDTSRCVFPFKHDNIDYYNCSSPDGSLFVWCGFNRIHERGEWSSCESEHPDGYLANDVEILLSSNDLSWRQYKSCGKNTQFLFNANRTISCSENIMNTRFVQIRKKSDLRFAQIKIKLYKFDEYLTSDSETWKSGDQGDQGVTLKISGCQPRFHISKIIWYFNSDNSSVAELTPTRKYKREFIIQRISPQHSGSYYYVYKNKRNETIYKSNILKKRVYYRSNFNKVVKNITGYENETFHVVCGVEPGYPHPEINIIINNMKIKGHISKWSDGFGGKGMKISLNITLQKSFNNSLIKCISKQNYSLFENEINSRKKVLPNYRSKFRETFAKISGYENETRTLVCSVIGGYPAPELSILIDYTAIKVTPEIVLDGKNKTKSVTIKAKINLKKSYRNPSVLCKSVQNGEFYQEKIIAWIEIKRPSLSTNTPDLVKFLIASLIAASFVLLLLLIFIFFLLRGKRRLNQETDKSGRQIEVLDVVEYVELNHNVSSSRSATHCDDMNLYANTSLPAPNTYVNHEMSSSPSATQCDDVNLYANTPAQDTEFVEYVDLNQEMSSRSVGQCDDVNMYANTSPPAQDREFVEYGEFCD